MFLNGSLSVGLNNTIDLKIFYGNERVHYNLQYVNSLGVPLGIKGIEVSSPNLLLQYPHNTLSTSETKTFYLGTLTYDPSNDYANCKDLLCHVLPAKNSQDITMKDLPSSVSLAMLQKRTKSKQYYQEMNKQQHIEELSINTDLAGELSVKIHIRPVLLDLFMDPRHQVSHLLSKGLYSVLDRLGFYIDWYGNQQTPVNQNYRQLPSIQLDQDEFFQFHLKTQTPFSYRVKDLCNIKSLTIKNGQYLSIDGYDLHFFTDTVVNTSHSTTIPVFNPLDSPLLVRLVYSYDKDYPSEYIPTNCTDAFSLDDNPILEAVIPPNGRVDLGPIHFHPTELGICSTYVFIVNNYTSVESCILCLSHFIHSTHCWTCCRSTYCSY